MNIECPSCQAKFMVDESKIPARGAKAKCPKCGGPIFVQKPQPAPEDFKDDRITCPSCGYRQKPGRECVSCGIVFERRERHHSTSPPGPPPIGPPPFEPKDGGSSMPPPMPVGSPAPPPPLRSRILPAILVTLFCCLPTGVAAIIFAALAGTRQAAGDYEGARRASRTAGILITVSVAVAAIITILGILSALFIPQFVKMSERSREKAPLTRESDDQETNEAPSYVQILTNLKTKGQDTAAGAALNNLKTAQESFYLEHGRYAASVDELDEWWTAEPNIEAEIIAADDDSWSAWARYGDSPNRFTYSSSEGN